MDNIVDELNSFTLIGFSDGSLVFTMVVRVSIYSVLCILGHQLDNFRAVLVGVK